MKLVIILIFSQALVYNAIAQQPKRLADSILLSYYQSQRFAEAAAYLKQAYPEPVTDYRALTQLAYTSEMAGKLADAENYYQRIYNVDSTNTAVLFNLGAINIRRGNDLQAGIFYRKIVQRDTTNFMVYKQLAKISLDKSDMINYLGYLLKANRLNPAEPDVASDLSDMLVSLKEPGKADTVLNKAIVADPENSVLLMSELKLTYSEGKWEEVVATGMQLQQLGDESGFVLTKLGIAYYNQKNYPCAIEMLAAISDQEQTETSFYIAALSYKALKQQAEAASYLAKAINAGISPNIADYYSEMGDSFELLKDFKKAITGYRKSLQFDEKPITYYLLASMYDTDLKDKKMAKLYYKSYIAAKPPLKEEKYLAYAKARIDALSVH
jgi:tetratricopeptide (TPR) repeat protein